MVLAILALAFVVMPLIELYVFVQVGDSIGFLNTIFVMIVISLVGAWLARHEGIGVLQRIRQQLDAGRMPTDHLIDGALVLTGGLLLLLPGFVSDIVGLLVLFPPTRALARNTLRRRFRVVTVRRYNGPIDRGPIDRGPFDRGPFDRDPYDRGPINRGPYDDGPGPPPVIDV